MAWTLGLERGAATGGFCLALAEGPPCGLWTDGRCLVQAVDLRWVQLAGVPR